MSNGKRRPQKPEARYIRDGAYYNGPVSKPHIYLLTYMGFSSLERATVKTINIPTGN